MPLCYIMFYELLLSLFDSFILAKYRLRCAGKKLIDYYYPNDSIQIHKILYLDSVVVVVPLPDYPIYNMTSIENTNEIWQIVDSALRNHITDEDLALNNKIEVRYIYKGRKYRCILDRETAFPMYDVAAIDSHFASKTFKKGVLMAQTDKEDDITGIMKEYSGPLGDFYGSLSANMILNDDDEYLLNHCSKIMITDTYANDREFSKDDLIIL